MNKFMKTLKNKVLPSNKAPQYIPFAMAPNYYWDKTPLGLDSAGKPVFWDHLDVNNMLLTGRENDIENTLQNIIFHHSIHSDRWEIRGIDPSKKLLDRFSEYDFLVSQVATSLEDGLILLEELHDEMMLRYSALEAEGVHNVDDLTEKKKHILFILQDAHAVLTTQSFDKEQKQKEGEMIEKASVILRQISRLSRAAGIHLILSTSRPSSNVISGETKMNMAARVAASKIDALTSFMTFESDEEKPFNESIAGSSYALFTGYTNGKPLGFAYTSFKASPTWLEEKLAAKTPGLTIDGKASYWDPKIK